MYKSPIIYLDKFFFCLHRFSSIFESTVRFTNVNIKVAWTDLTVDDLWLCRV